MKLLQPRGTGAVDEQRRQVLIVGVQELDCLGGRATSLRTPQNQFHKQDVAPLHIPPQQTPVCWVVIVHPADVLTRVYVAETSVFLTLGRGWVCT